VSTLIAEACRAGGRLQPACGCLGLSLRTLQRRRSAAGIKGDARAAAGAARTPANRLDAATRAAILEVANRPEFAHQAPNQIVPALADRGLSIASASSFYRVLREAGQLARRGKARAPTQRRPAPRQATAPNPLWSWDITYLANTVKGSFFYLYLIMDVFSRKIVGWEVFAQESAEHAAAVFTAAHRREGVPHHTLVLHSDNGSPMKGATMLATLQRLGVVPSFSRPATSNDNPFSEALFKTLEYQPNFPAQPFDGLACARRRVEDFVARDNEHHRHSALKFVTPGQRHRGEDHALLAQRRRLYEAAKAQHPERWSGSIRNWEPDSVVLLNPGKPLKQEPQTTPQTA
jgi:transposase InsO family protein